VWVPPCVGRYLRPYFGRNLRNLFSTCQGTTFTHAHRILISKCFFIFYFISSFALAVGVIWFLQSRDYIYKELCWQGLITLATAIAQLTTLISSLVLINNVSSKRKCICKVLNIGLKGQCHEMVVEVRPWSGRLALN
jgi:hypothetical protein